MSRWNLLSLCSILALQSWGQVVHEVSVLNIDPSGEDYAPVFLDSGFVMCSVREAPGAISVVDANTEKPLSDLYWVPFANGRTGRPVLFSSMLNTPVNEGPAAFTDGGRTICYTRNLVLPKRLSGRALRNGQLGLFFSVLQNGAWGSPVGFEHNSEAHSLMHPTLSPDGRTLIFASDMAGGHGGMDLYLSQRTGFGWSRPENLGTAVNSAANEVYPRFGRDGRIYFSSDRPGGEGGLDIHTCDWQNDRPTGPQRLPASINSPQNDHGYEPMGDGVHALFSSDRTGVDRIHLDKRTIPPFQACDEQQRNNYCYSLKQKHHPALTTLPLDHVWDMGDGTRINGLTAKYCYAHAGTYMVRSLLVDRRTGALFHALSANELNVSDHQQAWITAPDTVRTGRALALDGLNSLVPGMEPMDHRWDMGDGSKKEGARIQHQFKAPGIYTVKLDIIGAPDANGEIKHRCNTRTIVVIDRFRDHEDMSVVATYQDAQGSTHVYEYQELPFDNLAMTDASMEDVTLAVVLFTSKERISLEDARFIEIRKHYRIMERFDPQTGSYSYSVGETKNIDELYQVYRKVKELQFLDAEVFALRSEELMDLSQLDMATLDDLNHRKLRTSAIHFAYKSATIEPGSEAILDQLVTTLRQYPQLQLVIEAHTDDVGGMAYNIDLSQARARSVVEYLVGAGIATDRLTPIGHGKNQPIASNRTEQGRALNRRVEFRMVVKEGTASSEVLLSGATPERK